MRKLLKESLKRARSRSPSQSQPTSTATGSNQGPGSILSPSTVGASPADNPTTGTGIKSTSGTDSSGGAGAASLVPIIVEPTETIPAPGQKTQNAAWNELRRSLRVLTNTSSTFPPISSAVESVLACLAEFEDTTRDREDFEDLATELTGLANTLNQQMVASASTLMSDSAESVAISIKRQTAEIRERLERMRTGGIRDARADEEELVKHYRLIESHFKQLQTNVSMSTWSITNEHLVNTRLEGLRPVMQAAYDSSISTQVSRRCCKEGTRTDVLAGLDAWLDDPTSWPIYWMDGMAGTGKTTIASTFCERVEKRKLLAASFFCTRSSSDCRNVTRIVPTIAYQLARYSIPYQAAICKILGQSPDIGSKNITKQFEQLLNEPLQQVKDAISQHILIVIDALDECDDRDGVERILSMLFKYAPQVPLKFLVTSRPEPEIYAKMSAHTQSQEVIHLHEIEKSLVRADIELYLTDELRFMSPTPAEMEQLVDRSGALFIYAATLVRYIQFGKRLADPSKRLQSILSMTPEATKTHTHIDALYTAVLRSALNEEELEADECEDIRAVLRTVLFAQEPIGVETIATLAGIDDPRRVASALQPLRSVLHQSEQTGLVSTLHASFPDFMFSTERSGSYFCDVVDHSTSIAERCFAAMKEQLRFNICGLESSFMPDSKVKDPQARIHTNTSSTLAYACRHWADHLRLAPRSGSLLVALEEFLSPRLLSWVEVMNLRREMAKGIDGLVNVQKRFTQTGDHSSQLLIFLEDARNFVTGFAASAVSQSTPHIYTPALPLCPQSSMVHKHYWKRTQGLLKLKGSIMDRREFLALAVRRISQKALSLLSVAYFPDGSRIVVSDSDSSIYILDAYDGTILIEPLSDHNGAVKSVVFSPDGRLVASAGGSDDRNIRVWNALNGTLVTDAFQDHTSSAVCISFSPDGTRLASGSYDHNVRIWNPKNGALLLGPLRAHTGVVDAVIFSPDGTLVASASQDHTVRLWSSRTGAPVGSPFKGHNAQVECVTFTPDGTRVISGSRDGTILVWRTSDGSPVSTSFQGHASAISSVSVSPDGTRLASGSADRTIRVWRTEDGTPLAGPFVGHDSWVNSVSYSPDGTHIVSASGDRTIRVWPAGGGGPNFTPPLPSQNVVRDFTSAVFSPDGSRIMTSSDDRFIRFWDPDDEYGAFTLGRHIGNLQISPPSRSYFSPNQRYVAAIFMHGEIEILSIMDGSTVHGSFGIGNTLSVFQFAKDSASIIMGSKNGEIHIQPLQAGQAVASPLYGHTDEIKLIDQSLDCSRIVSYSQGDSTLRIWNILAPLVELESHTRSPAHSSAEELRSLTQGWHVTKDGWVINDQEKLLLWLPPDIASIWQSPYTSLIITHSGTLQIPKQKLLVGEQWARCYTPG